MYCILILVFIYRFHFFYRFPFCSCDNVSNLLSCNIFIFRGKNHLVSYLLIICIRITKRSYTNIVCFLCHFE